MKEEQHPKISLWRKILAYGVHLFTASGAIFALFSLHYVGEKDWYTAYLLLVIATLIDSCDGLWARKIQVQKVLPEIDGSLLDNIIDFLVWSIIPAFIVWEGDLLAPGYNYVIVSLICFASIYQFCRSDAKSNIDKPDKSRAQTQTKEAEQAETEQAMQDYFFRGFPSAWILLVYFLIFSTTSQTFNAIILSTCVLLSFVPVKCIYPTRTKMWKKTNILVTAVWLAALLATFFSHNPLPQWFLFLSLIYLSYYIIASIRLTWLLRTKRRP